MSNATVTQKDLHALQASLVEAMTAALLASEERLTAHLDERIAASEERMTRHLEGRIATTEERMIRHFDVTAEQLAHDFRGVFSDRTEQLKDGRLDHERRLQRIERKLQIV